MLWLPSYSSSKKTTLVTDTHTHTHTQTDYSTLAMRPRTARLINCYLEIQITFVIIVDSRQSSLRIRFHINTGDKPYQCQYCGKGFY